MQGFNRVGFSAGSKVFRRRAGQLGHVESLESRTLLTATVTAALPNVNVPTNSSATTVNLSNYFDDNQVPGDFVLMQTNEGVIPIAIDSNVSQIKTTVDNFETYVTAGAYNNTVFHRVITEAQGGIGIIQGGGYTTSLAQVPNLTQPQEGIALQYDLPNAPYTIAMARTSSPNSATNEWFFNAIDNSQTLGASNGGGYAVFGTALYQVGENTINTIYGLQQVSLETGDGQTQSNFPVTSSYTGGTPTPNDYVIVQSATKTSPLQFAVTSSNDQIVTTSVASDGTLTLNYTGQAGTATIDVNATDYGGTTVTSSFTVSVGVASTTPVTLGKGGARTIKFTDPNGVAGTATLTGPGSATVDFTGYNITASAIKVGVETVSGTPQSISIATTGTTAGSALSVTGAVSLAGITTDASIGSITASRASLAGDLTVAGTANTINLDAVSGGTIAINSAGRSTTLKVDSATGESVSSAGAIASITAGSWTNGGGMSATAINRIADTGELNAEISTPTLGQVTAGSITSSVWAVSGKVSGITAGSITGLNLAAGLIGPITDRGAAQGDEITAAGNIGAISALSMSGTRINAAVDSADANGLANSFSSSATISSVVIGKGGFGDSAINAPTLGRVNLGTLSSSNNGTPFGLASSDIVSLIATIDGKRVTLSRATTQADVSAALTKAGETLTDLVIRIV